MHELASARARSSAVSDLHDGRLHPPSERPSVGPEEQPAGVIVMLVSV
jgi:hypothetical protein